MRRPQKTCAICESRRAGRGLQGRAHPVPVPDRARQDPAEPALGHLRPAPAAAEHRDQAGPAAGPAAVHQGLRRLTAAAAPRGPAAGGAVWSWPATCSSRRRSSVRPAGRAAAPQPARHGAGVGLAAGAGVWSALWLKQAGGLGGPVRPGRAVLLPAVSGADALAAIGARSPGPLAAAALAPGRGSWSGCGISGSAGPSSSAAWSRTLDAIRTAVMGSGGAPARPAGSARPGAAMVHTRRMLYPALLASPRSRGCGWPGPGTTGWRGVPSASRRRRFRAFGFSDQLVWGWVAAMALAARPGAGAVAPSGSESVARAGPCSTPTRGLAVSSARSGRCAGAGGRDPDPDRHVPVAVRRRGAHAARTGRHLARFPASARDAGHLRDRPMIEVILREDVKSLGKAGEMVRVKPGYARNFLLPQGWRSRPPRATRSGSRPKPEPGRPATRPSGSRPSASPPRSARWRSP